MRKTILTLMLALISLIQYGQIIADHTVVDKYDDIPEYYKNIVKTMLINMAGESHKRAYIDGMKLLEQLNSNYAVYETSDPTGTHQAGRLGFAGALWGDYDNATGWVGTHGEEDWFTNSTAESRIKNHLLYCHNNNYVVSALGFGWCYDADAGNKATNPDPVYGVRWSGQSKNGPDGDLGWGLDASDQSLTGNSVSMDTYISKTQEYIDYCLENGINTKVFFTTGPVDSYENSEEGYQAYLKWERLRNYVNANPSRILFDYADILCWDDNGTQTTNTWNGHVYPHITATNLGSGNYAHIGQPGQIRIAKALWWMMARIAGWNGGTTTVPVTNITVNGTNGSNTITSDNGTLQLSATISPSNATNTSVSWSVQNGTGQASISSSGLVTAIANGTVTAIATSNDNSGVSGNLIITISNQSVTSIEVNSISVTAAGSVNTVSKGTAMQMFATVLPSNATNKTITWSLIAGTGHANINSSGWFSALGNGTVTVRATANDGSGVYGEMFITIADQIVLVSDITVSEVEPEAALKASDGTTQLNATITPSDASDKTITWTVLNGTGQASISSSGLLTPTANGTVTARATANDGSGIYGELTITVANQDVFVSNITVLGTGGASTITTYHGTLQLSADILPLDATNKTITWSVINGTGQATINSSGLLTAVANGTVTVVATSNDGSGVTGAYTVIISNQTLSNVDDKVSAITITSATGVNTISSGRAMQMLATAFPASATNKTVTWSLIEGTGHANINSSGWFSAFTNGTVTIIATANDGSGVYGEYPIIIGSQSVSVSSITLTGTGGATTITTNGGTLQISACVLPSDAGNKSVTWSVINGTGHATVNSSGLLTAIANGTVTVRATANDGSGITGTLTISISNQATTNANVAVNAITITSSSGVNTIACGSAMQMLATVLPVNATNKNVVWSVSDGTGHAFINTSGWFSALASGTVTVWASAIDGSGVYGQLQITIGSAGISSKEMNTEGYTDNIGQTIAEEVNDDNYNIEVYPNPATEFVYVKTNFESTIRILNLSGAVIFEQNNKNDILKLDNRLKSGIYFVQVINNKTNIVTTKKLIIK